jgi:hypothetical protein
VRAVEHLLSARRFQVRAIRALARRTRYADAANHLGVIADSDDLPRLLAEHCANELRMWRLALIFGLERQTNERTLNPLSLKELRERGREDERARMVLCAYGEIDWGGASARERAAFCLNGLVTARLAFSS